MRISGVFVAALIIVSSVFTNAFPQEGAREGDADLQQKKNTAERPVRKFPDPVSLYHYNYFLLGNTGDNEFHDSGINNRYSKFRISIKYRMFLWTRRKDTTGLYFAYTQKSLWDLLNFRNSSPFIESNYSPEFFYRFDLEKKTILGIHMERLKYVQLGLWEHESNGLGSAQIVDSRSWDRGYLEFEYSLAGRYLSVIPKFWWVYHKAAENSDITRYMGYGQLTLKSTIGIDDVCELIFLASGRKGISPDVKKGNIELTMIIGSFRYHYREEDTMIPVGVFIQFFTGYGETLMQYDRTNRVLRAGFSFLH